MVRLPQSWWMDLLLHGATHTTAVTHLECKSSWGVWQTNNRLLRGPIQTMVVTPLRSKIISGMCNRFMRLLLRISSGTLRRLQGRVAHLLRSWQMDRLWRGVLQKQVVTAPKSKMSSGLFSKLKGRLAHLLRS